jgi:deoxycytidine triphosphate deaminase
MYLSDSEIKAKLNELNIECSDSNETFSSDEQIQPCSIDLRLDNVFWRYKKVKTIDLRRRKLLELSPRRYFKRIVIGKGECITIQPGELVLGRIYEVFTVPKDCASKIEGRSSFARLGLSVQIGSDFINPGYRGHMTLQLVNHGKNPIKIYPFIPICQMMLVKLSSTPSRLYGEQELQSKYKDDDGGPSYWWRDKRIKRLQSIFLQKDIALNIQETLLERIGIQEPEIIERFEKFASNQKTENLTNPEYLLSLFYKREKKLERNEKILLNVVRVLLAIMTPTLITTSWNLGFKNVYTIVTIIIFAILLGLTIYSFLYEPKQFLTEKEMMKQGII